MDKEAQEKIWKIVVEIRMEAVGQIKPDLGAVIRTKQILSVFKELGYSKPAKDIPIEETIARPATNA